MKKTQNGLHNPITFKKFKGKNGSKTICQAHREIYYLLNKESFSHEDKERCIELIQEVYDYGIRMSKKLHEYAGKEWREDVFEK